MAKICEICKKGTATGRNIRHKSTGSWELKAQRTARKLFPNLRSIRVENETGATENIKVCMKCYKRIKSL